MYCLSFKWLWSTRLQVEGNKGDEWKRTVKYITFPPVHMRTFPSGVHENLRMWTRKESNVLDNTLPFTLYLHDLLRSAGIVMCCVRCSILLFCSWFNVVLGNCMQMKSIKLPYLYIFRFFFFKYHNHYSFSLLPASLPFLIFNLQKPRSISIVDQFIHRLHEPIIIITVELPSSLSPVT